MSAPLRVLLANDHLGWGGTVLHGVGQLFLLSIPRFDPARARIVPVILRRRDALADRFDRAGIPLRFLARRRFDPRTLFDFRRLIRDEKIDVMHVQGYAAGTFGRLASAMTGVPCVLTVHSVDPRYPRYMGIADRLLAGRTARCLVMNESLRRFCVAACRVPAERIEKVPLGIDLSRFDPERAPSRAAARRALGIDPEATVVGTVTRLFEQKGNRYLLEAMAKVPGATLVVAGDGPLRGELEGEAARLGIAGRVLFLGFRDDVPLVLRALDVAVIASLWEATPLTSFEALAAGAALVATRVDGLAETLEDGRTALLVPPADAPALAAAIARLLSDAALRERLGAAARAESASYSIDAHVARLTAVYEAVAAEAGKR